MMNGKQMRRAISTRRQAYGNFDPPARQVQRAPLSKQVRKLHDETDRMYSHYVEHVLTTPTTNAIPLRKPAKSNVDSLNVSTSSSSLTQDSKPSVISSSSNSPSLSVNSASNNAITDTRRVISHRAQRTSSQQLRRGKRCREMFVEELQTRLSRFGFEEFYRKSIIVDCRSYEEYSVSTIKGAIHISALEKRMLVDRREFAEEEMSELVEEIICIDTLGMRSAHVALQLQDRGVYYNRIFNLRGGLLHWTHIQGELHVPPDTESVMLYHDTMYGTDDDDMYGRGIGWRKTKRIHVVADCWKLQHPDYEAVTFHVNQVSDGWKKRQDALDILSDASEEDEKVRIFSDDDVVESEADTMHEEDIVELSSISSSDLYNHDRSALWFPYISLRDFWYLMPLNFFRGYMNHAGGSSKRHTTILDPTAFDDIDLQQGDKSGYFPGR